MLSVFIFDEQRRQEIYFIGKERQSKAIAFASVAA